LKTGSALTQSVGSSCSRDTARLLALALTLLVLGGAVRLSLAWRMRADLSELAALEVLQVFWTGLRLDAVVAGYVSLLGGLLLWLPGVARRPALRVFVPGVLAAAVFAHFVELGFFTHFGFRPNYLVLEHWRDREVWSAILQGELDLGLLAAGLALAALAWLVWRSLARRVATALEACLPARLQHAWLHALVLPLVAFLAARGTLDNRPLNPSAAAVGTNRIASELAASGLFNVAYDFAQRRSSTRQPLGELQELLPMREAWQRARTTLGQAAPFTNDSAHPLLRVVSGRSGAQPLRNVVIVVMESFSARLVGSMGGRPSLAPEFDALAEEGLLLTRCYATGERTIQGLEAVLSSFPPLPGVSVVRRPEARRNFATLASVLAPHGYTSRFLYGGQGIFDHMRGFFLANGFDSFIEERDFAAPTFRGSWGVSDEDLFHRANQEFQQMWEAGQPFLGTILTVSLHSPWEFPAGRAPKLPRHTLVPEGYSREELSNFLYADFAIGEFMREARRLPYFADTLFVFVGDHPVHIRGRSLLPSEQFRVPALFLAPGHVPAGRLDAIASQLDIAPTILGLLGRPFRSPFFGRDLRASDPSEALAIMVYNKQRYGVRRARRLTVLENRTQRFYDVGYGDEALPALPRPDHREDASDALALLQVADDLLRTGRFTTERCPGTPRARTTAEAGLGCEPWRGEARSELRGGS